MKGLSLLEKMLVYIRCAFFPYIIGIKKDSEGHINKIAPKLFDKFPNMKSLSKADENSLLPFIKRSIFHKNKMKWLLEIAETIQEEKNIPVIMK